MLGGVALLGVVTAGIASWMIDKVRDVEQTALAATHADIAALAGQITDLKQMIHELHASPQPVVVAMTPATAHAD